MSQRPIPGPTTDFERRARKAGHRVIAGVDEAGRGPLAGPVVAAAVVLNTRRMPRGLNDSKKLTAGRREALARDIREMAVAWSVASATVAEIDRLNILQASHLAMVRAIAGLGQVPSVALIDGNLVPKALDCPAEAIVKGDALSVSIAAASILAKTARDAMMVDLAQQCPGYGWVKNAGYPTKGHIAAIQALGITPHHRRSFAPIRNML